MGGPSFDPFDVAIPIDERLVGDFTFLDQKGSVLATITAEVYGPSEASYDQLINAGHRVRERLAREPGVADVDISAEDNQVRWIFETDKAKAALYW